MLLAHRLTRGSDADIDRQSLDGNHNRIAVMRIVIVHQIAAQTALASHDDVQRYRRGIGVRPHRPA